jgi:hypothetical protein
MWVIQKGDTMTTLFMNMSRGQRSAKCHWRNHLSTLMYALVYILFVSLSLDKLQEEGTFLMKSCIQRDLSAFRGTPKEAFTGVKPEIKHFGIFGCLVYFHVPKEKNSKPGPSGRKDTFMG